MIKVIFKQDMFTSNSECIEEGTVLNLKEFHDYFEIVTDSGYVVGRYDNDMKEEIYRCFNKISDGKRGNDLSTK